MGRLCYSSRCLLRYEVFFSLLLVVLVVLVLLLIMMLSPQTTHRMAATCNFAFLDAALCCRNDDLAHLLQPRGPVWMRMLQEGTEERP